MREIKFRGKDMFSGKWLYGAYIPTEFTQWREPSIFDGHHRAEVDGTTIGQYTGYKDADGKEIYEGDVLQSFISDKTNRGVVEFRGGAWQIWDRTKDKMSECWMLLDWTLFRIERVKVVGNIHDNPELMEGKNDK